MGCIVPRTDRNLTDSMNAFGTRLMTWWHGELVGADSFGNRYYKHRKNDRRWVLYNGEPEASKVPPEWHVWLHHTSDALPLDETRRAPWQKPHLPNLTGTGLAYRPPGSVVQGGQRAPATGDYEAWRPD